ncbi:GIY-YIG nuclease family protein [Streptococcaceae bacterium ESL0729]|nr:GIY-YIG nuclease family protein [Streptococcaceae bacterium ESL0729]
MDKNKAYFYVLLCQDRSFYGGYTTDLAKRVDTHNKGCGAKYTKTRLPVKLIYWEAFASKNEALKREYWFKKKLNRRQKEKFLLEKGANKKDLIR